MRYLLGLLRVVGLVLIVFMACIDFGADDDQGCGLTEDKCIGVVCADDGNECTRDCNPSTGACDYRPFIDGRSCDDGNDNECAYDVCIDGACTGEGEWTVNGTPCTFAGAAGVCVEGVCGENLCEGVDCNDEPCSTGKCDYVDGLCDYTPRLPNGTVCTYDGMDGVCVNGVCGENLCEGVDCNDEPCSPGNCDYVDGLCDYEPRLPNGTVCTHDGMDGVCVNGVCGENLCEGVDCDDEPCRMGNCDYVDGTCDYIPFIDGRSCDDGNDNECAHDVCIDGACTGEGAWKVNGTPCTFAGAAGVCVQGVCGENLCEGVDCDDDDACAQGTCDYVDGTCDFAPVVCDDDNECTEDTCNPAIGCEHAAAADGTPCRVGAWTCQDGICARYAQDFESLDQGSRTALRGDGWLIFGQVVDGSGGFKFDYGPFPAPNGVAAFCDLVTGEGGPDQGAQQLMVYSDYNCCDPDQGHRNGTDRVTSLVFQQPFTLGNEISEDDVGKNLKFSFDAKRGNINDPTGSSTALAFIQTVDPNAGFAQTNFVSVDMTNLPAVTWDRYSISLTIDAGLVGQLLDFGFLSTASNFDPSGVFYDNIVSVLEAP